MNVIEILKENNPQAILWDDLDEAVIGYTEEYVAVYSISKLIECLKKNNPDWSHDDAIEWFDYNISSVHLGENTPIHIYYEDYAD